MEEFARLAAGSLTVDDEVEIYSNTNGAIVKTIMLYNSNTEVKEITLNLDGVIFSFSLNSKETKIISESIVTNLIKITGNGINIHISGIQLGGEQMANIEHLLDDIRKNKYCVDMKETFCNALNEANANAEKNRINC